MIATRLSTCLSAALALLATACSLKPDDRPYPDRERREQYRYGSILQKNDADTNEGFSLTGLLSPADPAQESAEDSSEARSYIWQAALDVVGFMPIQSADSAGGVIATDWKAVGEGASERLKLNVIIDRASKQRPAKVTVFRQIWFQNNWQEAAVNPQTSLDFERAIVDKARSLAQINQNRK